MENNNNNRFVNDHLLKHKNLVMVMVAALGGIALLVFLCLYVNNKENIKPLISPPSGSSSAAAGNVPASGQAAIVPEYDYHEASAHIGEHATVSGAVVKTFTAKSSVTFFDFCQGFDSCPFSAVVFASDLEKFGDLSRYVRAVKVTGVIKSYQGNAEMVLNSPDQIQMI
jgi:hypothetical protein